MTPTEFKTLFPEYAAKPDSTVQMYIDMADASFDVCRWGSFYVQGLGYWVAHQVALADEITASGGAAMVDDYSQERVGDLSISRDSSLSLRKASNPFMRTAYGQQYLYYLRLVGIGAVAV